MVSIDHTHQGISFHPLNSPFWAATRKRTQRGPVIIDIQGDRSSLLKVTRRSSDSDFLYSSSVSLHVSTPLVLLLPFVPKGLLHFHRKRIGFDCSYIRKRTQCTQKRTGIASSSPENEWGLICIKAINNNNVYIALLLYFFYHSCDVRWTLLTLSVLTLISLFCYMPVLSPQKVNLLFLSLWVFSPFFSFSFSFLFFFPEALCVSHN